MISLPIIRYHSTIISKDVKITLLRVIYMCRFTTRHSYKASLSNLMTIFLNWIFPPRNLKNLLISTSHKEFFKKNRTFTIFKSVGNGRLTFHWLKRYEHGLRGFWGMPTFYLHPPPPFTSHIFVTKVCRFGIFWRKNYNSKSLYFLTIGNLHQLWFICDVSRE